MALKKQLFLVTDYVHEEIIDTLNSATLVSIPRLPWYYEIGAAFQVNTDVFCLYDGETTSLMRDRLHFAVSLSFWE